MGRKKTKRPGRPPLQNGRHERVNVTLPPDVLAYLAEIGNGNRSGAISQLARTDMARRKT